MKKNPSKSAIISLLAADRRYAYELTKLLRASAPHILANGEGLIYPLLHRIEDQKLIKGSWKPNPKGRLRRYYSLTKKGKKQLEKNST